MEFKHIPVLLKESILELNIKRGGIYIDGTLGAGGHSLEICKELNNSGRLIGIDQDNQILEIAKQKLKDYPNVEMINGNHQNIKEIMSLIDVSEVDGILLDLGVSSLQLDDSERGFSYMKQGRLDMRMNRNNSLSAEKVINEYTKDDLIKILFEYGEERFAKKIVESICNYRKEKRIETTEELVELVRASIPLKQQKDGHPAKRTFQAIRIEVNNEIKPLETTIKDAVNLLKPQGRLCIITFHSLEDRIVKNSFIELEGRCKCPKDLPYCICKIVKHGRIITKKPIIPTLEEVDKNPRSKSAKLRVFEKI